MPLVVLVEDVPDLLNHGGQNIAEEIYEVLECLRLTLLNAAFYGVPQWFMGAVIAGQFHAPGVAVDVVLLIPLTIVAIPLTIVGNLMG